MPQPPLPTQIDATSWAALAQRASIASGQKLLLALSGGADSTYLLQVLAAAEPRPAIQVLHVQHGLRGTDSEQDERFCAQLCSQLGLPYQRVRVRLDAELGSLENQARRARYAALRRVALATGHHAILTAHQAEDAVETLVWRWIRGSSPQALRGPRRRMQLNTEPGSAPLWVLRPMLDLGRDQIREQLLAAGMTWREDLSNLDESFTRNRLRQRFLPFLERHAGAGWARDLARFTTSREALEEHLEALTGELAWRVEPDGLHSLPRAALAGLVPGLQSRALWRLLTEAMGRGPRSVLLEKILGDLQAGRTAQHSLGMGCILRLESDFLRLGPPKPPQVR